jgi:macrodomain Ter protein organizer (MatP/YcbG family)
MSSSLPSAHNSSDELSERLRSARRAIDLADEAGTEQEQILAYKRTILKLVPQLVKDLLDARRYDEMLELLDQYLVELGDDICTDLHKALRGHRKRHLDRKQDRHLYDRLGSYIDCLADEVGDISVASDASEDEYAEISKDVVEKMKNSDDPGDRLMALVGDGQREIKRQVRRHMKNKARRQKQRVQAKRKRSGGNEAANKRRKNSDDSEYKPGKHATA